MLAIFKCETTGRIKYAYMYEDKEKGLPAWEYQVIEFGEGYLDTSGNAAGIATSDNVTSGIVASLRTTFPKNILKINFNVQQFWDEFIAKYSKTTMRRLA